MPVYNGQDFIDQAILSILAQDEEEFELIISDNASTDGTSKICKNHEKNDKRIRYIRNDINIGAEINFKTVLTEASGNFFMWAAHDDTWEPSYLSTMLKLFKNNPNAAIVFSAFNNIDTLGNEIKRYNLQELTSQDLFERLFAFMKMEEKKGKANAIYGLFKRESILKQKDLFFECKDLWGADMLSVFKILTSGYLVLDDQILFHKRITLQSKYKKKIYRNIVDKLRSKTNEYYRYIHENHRYFAVYFNVIKRIGGITLSQKVKFGSYLLAREINAALHK